MISWGFRYDLFEGVDAQRLEDAAYDVGVAGHDLFGFFKVFASKHDHRSGGLLIGVVADGAGVDDRFVFDQLLQVKLMSFAQVPSG